MRRLYLLSLALFLTGATCPPSPPQPVPTPTPGPTPAVDSRPTVPVYTSLLLRQMAGKLVHPDGSPYRVVGAIPCWPVTDDSLKVDGKPVDYWWPLVSPSWEDATKPKGVNAYHMRLGPSYAKDMCCGNQSIGGPYAEVSAQALRRQKRQTIRLGADQWNPKFWARVHQGLQHAGQIGSLVEVDVLDGWNIKHAIQGDFSMPWPAADVANATAVPLNASVSAWVAKVTFETCNYGSIFYQISNESDQIPGWTPTWERAMYAAIRAGEQQAGCGAVVHVIGSNTGDADLAGPFDYFQQHNGVLVSPIAGRPMMENEWNPHLSPASFKALCDSALAQGTGCFYWRSDGSDADQDASLNSILGPVDPGCPVPQPDRSRLAFNIACNAGNGICDTTPLVVNSCEYMASIGMGTYNGQPRCSGPTRNECGSSGQPNPADQDPANPGPSFQCDKRLACEQFIMQAPAPVLHSDGTIVLLDSAGFRFTCNGCSWVEACNHDSSTCSRFPYPK